MVFVDRFSIKRGGKTCYHSDGYRIYATCANKMCCNPEMVWVHWFSVTMATHCHTLSLSLSISLCVEVLFGKKQT